MNRRNLLQRAWGVVIGAGVAMVGIWPRKAKAVSAKAVSPNLELGSIDGPRYRLVLRSTDVGSLRLWLAERFYVDLPDDRYTDTVCIDWTYAKELENLYVAQCRVCPDLGKPWEVLPMRRIDG